MINPSIVLWDIGYSLYPYFTIFIIILAIWQVKKSYCGLKLEPKRSCCLRHRKVRQRTRDAAAKARRFSQEAAQKPKDQLSVIISQGWLPQEGSVRRLLCADSSCNICNDVVLDIQQQLVGENTLLCPTSPEPLQDSSCQETVSKHKVTFDQHLERYSPLSKQLSAISQSPARSQLKGQKSFHQPDAQSTSALSIQEHWSEHQINPGLQVSEMLMGREAMSSSKSEESGALVNEQKRMKYNSNFLCRNQDQQPLNSQVSVVTINQEITTTTLAHPGPLQTVGAPPNQTSIISPAALRLLEVHVKKWLHFQRWGLPRRVEESLRQLMPQPPLLYWPKNNQPLCFIHSDIPRLSVENVGAISYQTWGSCMSGQPTQAFWVSEWPTINLKHRHLYQQISNGMTETGEDLTGLYPLPGEQLKDSVGLWQHNDSQLFCGLPSLHSESLAANILNSQGFCKRVNVPSLHRKDPFALKELSFLALLPKTPPEAAPPPSPSSPSWITQSDHQQTQANVPFLTLDQCEALEWHVLQRQLQLQWGWPAVLQRSQLSLRSIKSKSCDTTQSPESVKASWPEKSISVLTRDLLYFPEHARRLLEFHLQRQLTHHRWGLPPKIQQSMQLLLAPTEQQALALSSTALENTSLSQPTAQMPSVAGDLFTHTVNPEPIDMPHLFAQAKAILQSHIDSKCGQIHQGKVPVCVYSSWEYIIPGGLKVSPFFCLPESKPLELQATPEPNPQKRVGAEALGQLQAPSRAVTEHPKLPCALPEGTVEKLETTLRHKYLAFLSGLPALYYVALSRAVLPEVTAQAIPPKTMTEPEQILTEPLTQGTPSEEQHPGPEPGAQDSNQTPADTTDEIQTDEQEEGLAKTEPLHTQSETASPTALKKPFLNKLNFHMRKKTLELQLGIPTKARESRDQTQVIPENGSTQETLGSLSNQGEASLPKEPSHPDTACTPDPKWLHLKQQLANELKSIQQNQKQPSPSMAAHGSESSWVSKISQQPRGDMTEAQVLCVQLEASANKPSLQEPWSPEAQSSGKSKDSAQVPTPTTKTDDPKLAGGHGEGDAGFVLSPTREESQPSAVQSPAGICQSRTPHSLRRRNRTLHLDAPGQHSPQLKLPQQAPVVRQGKEAERHLQDVQTKAKATLKPARIPQSAQPVAPRGARGQPFLGHLPQGSPLQRHPPRGQLLLGQVMPVQTHKRHGPPESGLRNKMKSFLHCINPKTEDRRHEDSMLLVAEKGPKTRRENVGKSLPPPTSPTGRTKTEKTRGSPQAPIPLTQKKVGVAFLAGPHSPDCKLRQGFSTHHLLPASVLGHRHHCPQHCPRRAFASQSGAHANSHLPSQMEIVT
ncbi:protein SPATA31F1-like [Erinaceus europaeus]|uniref:Protein SPATA31F1-like n=1 Tax=Erinaceus europaeus TaxID=9365 RepID=A0ABM3Y2D2_ERIEU|nr:protein SPATA31F1-like [Erinaceus europaeus]